MALNAPTVDEPTTSHVVTRRLPGPDVVRAVALIGVVVMNFHGYLLLAADESSGTLARRRRVGGGVVRPVGRTAVDTLRGDVRARRRRRRHAAHPIGRSTRSARRATGRGHGDAVAAGAPGVLLYIVGLVLDMIWPGTIIPYYGAMFVGAAAIFTLRTRWIVADRIWSPRSAGAGRERMDLLARTTTDTRRTG